MKPKAITELVQFKALESTSDEQIDVAVSNLYEFLKSLEGVIDAELVKNIKENVWHIVFHFENFEKVQEVGPVLRSNHVFADFTSLIKQESLSISFHEQVMKW